VLAFLLCGRHAKGGQVVDDDVYVAINSHWDTLEFEIPAPSAGRQWRVAVNTGAASPGDAYPQHQEPLLTPQERCLVGGRSVVILVGR
jgi:isoamylase